MVSPLLSNIMLHEVDRQWCRGDGTTSNSVVLVRYADDMVLLARTESEARRAWERLQNQFAALRLALSIIAEKTQAGYTHVVDVDLKSYIDHELLMQLVARRVGDVRVLRLIRAWLKAGVLEEGRVTHPDGVLPKAGSPAAPLLDFTRRQASCRMSCRQTLS